jgi:hypothetical protein
MKRIGRIALLLCLGTVCGSAQFGGLVKKLTSKTGPDVGLVMTRGQDLIGYVTIATDNGIEAVEVLTTMFPPDKVQKVADLAVKYNELRAKRGDHDIDAESIQIASQIAAEMALLDSEWKTHLKEKSAAVKKADSRLALVILADGLAATQAPEAAKAMQSAIQDLRSDPTQVAKIDQMLSMATLLATVGTEAPRQATSFRTVRRITKGIAEAEKVQLGSDPSPDQVRDKVALKTSTKELTD